MAHGYKTLQHWNQWLTQHISGTNLLAAEKQLLAQLLAKHFGKQALLIGVPHQQVLLQTATISCHTLLSPLVSHMTMRGPDLYPLESDFHELPILTGSVDLVILPHTLELVDHPRQLLAEACRVVKPEGLIVICGFNPCSLWGLNKLLAHSTGMPWKANFIQASKIKNWLQLADFKLEKQTATLFLPPLENTAWQQKLRYIEKIGNQCLPMLSGVYLLLARAKVIPLTPIRLKWKQELGGIRISSTISGHIARQFKP